MNPEEWTTQDLINYLISANIIPNDPFNIGEFHYMERNYLLTLVLEDLQDEE